MSLVDSLKSTLRGALPPASRAYLHRGQRRARKTIRAVEHDAMRAFAAALTHLPLHLVAQLKDELHPTGTLDYQRSRIAMGVATAMELYRLRSCAKEPETVAWIESNIRPGDVMFDIGANVGAYSLVADAASAGRARIIAFEPSFATFAQLNHNVFLNHASARITSLCLAVSSETGVATFRYSDLHSGAALHTLAHHIGPADDHSQAVLTVSLDDLVRRFGVPVPNVMKIDVDGAEAAIIEGGAETLSRPELRSVLIELDDSLDETRLMIGALGRFGFAELSKHRRHASRYYNYVFTRRAALRTVVRSGDSRP